MSGFLLGTFEVRERLASGGMGQIWTGVHLLQEVPVAIKVIQSEGADDLHFKEVFRREVRAVAQLDHPGIVTLLDIGEVPEEAAVASEGAVAAGDPYLIMEYLERGSLDAVEYPLSWPRAREVLLAVLDGLAHAHARGITHRDLKPGNILLADRATGSPVRLADFGIAFSYREGRPQDAEGTVSGTPAYMAPEQFVGEWRDYGPWTDLYALGCIAYQLASGRVPFQQRDLMALAAAHITEPPPELALPPGYPPGFAEWVEKLLGKSQDRRYRRCADAAVALASLAAEPPAPHEVLDVEQRAAPGGSITELDWPPPSAPTRSFRLVGAGLSLFRLRTVPFVDREPERDLLWRTLKRVSEPGSAALVALEGPAGAGKSRLVEWFGERAHELGLAEYLKAEHNGTGGRESGLSHMLASSWSSLGSTPDELRGRVATVLSAAGVDSPPLQRAVCEFLAPASLGDDYTPGMFHDAPSRTALFGSLFEVLRRVYTGRPLVVLLDDVHWGLDALEFARYAWRRSLAEPVRMMMLTTARDDLLAESVEASRLISELRDLGATTYRQLEPLTAADTRVLMRSTLFLQGDLAERVSVRSGGNPLYATQLVGDWVSRGILKAGSSGFVLSTAEEPEVPDSVHALWTQRLERVLDESVDTAAGPSTRDRLPEAQLALELAAALKGRVSTEEWAAVCARAGVSDPRPVLDALLAARLARVDTAGWSFGHSMLRDSVERIAKEGGRWASHNQLCADVLEQRHPVPRWGESERIGRHRYEAGQFDAAVAPLIRGARERVRLEEFSAALELLEKRDRALDATEEGSSDRSRFEGWVARADIHCTRRELAEAETLATRVISNATTPDTRRFVGESTLILARVRQHQGRPEAALEQFTEARRILQVVGPKAKLAVCLSEEAQVLLEINRLDLAWGTYNDAQAIYEEIGQLVPWAENQLGLARVALRQGNPEDAATLCERVRAFARREGLDRVDAASLMTLSDVRVSQGLLEDAESLLEKSVALFEQLGLERQALRPKSLRALLQLQLDDGERARVLFERLKRTLDTELPRATRALVDGVELALMADGPDAGFRSAFDRAAPFWAETGVVPGDVARCVEVAVERARRGGFEARVGDLERLGATGG